MILQKLHSDIAAFEHVTNSKSSLEFSNLVENITVTIKSFGDGADTPQKSNLKSLIIKLPVYLRIQWAFSVNELDIQFRNLQSFLD
jgi:hypothetical protein